MKPTALSDVDLSDLELRLVKGWVVRRDQIQALIAMARERNVIVRAQETQPATSSVYQ